MDFQKITNETDLYNFHSHTQFCDGRYPMEDFVKSAIALGYSHYGFSPHSPIPVESSCNMKMQDVELYVAEYNRLKELYGDKINLYLSMEVDYINDVWNPANEYYHKIGLDYIIGSVHFLETSKGEYIDMDGDITRFTKNMAQHFDNDIRSVVNIFYDTSEKMIEKGGIDIIGHFDKIGNNASKFSPGIESETWYEKRVKRLFEAIIDNNIIVEINTKSYNDGKRFFPNVKYFSWIKKYNVPYLVNSDTHFKDLIDFGRREAFVELRKP